MLAEEPNLGETGVEHQHRLDGNRGIAHQIPASAGVVQPRLVAG